MRFRKVLALLLTVILMQNINAKIITGETVGRYELYSVSNDNPGKTHGICDIEAFCNLAPVQIGNRIWSDNDEDGIQDASESGLESIIVTLYNDLCEIVAIDTTNQEGEYYFSDAEVSAYTAQADSVLASNA